MSTIEKNMNFENPKISVIIPVHNTEKYLEKCLDSVLNQTFEDIEVICIDDTSSDSSLDILREYEQKDPRIRVFVNEINQGQGYTRNYGVGLARGEYINFMDSDDYIPPHTYEKYFNFIELNDVDFVVGNVCRFNENVILKDNLYEAAFKNIKEPIPSTHISKNPDLVYDSCPVNKLIKKSFLINNNIYFPENRIYYEDVFFTFTLHCLSSKIGVLNDELYFWRERADSSSTSQKLNQMKNFNDRITIINLIKNFMDENNVQKNIRDIEYFKWLEHDLTLFIDKINDYNSENYDEIIDEIINILEIVPQDIKDKLPFYRKIMYKMIENRDIKSLLDFSEKNRLLDEKPDLINNIKEDYYEYVDFTDDVKEKSLIAYLYDYKIGDEYFSMDIKTYLPYTNIPFKLGFKLVKAEEFSFNLVNSLIYDDLNNNINLKIESDVYDIQFLHTDIENVYRLRIPIEYILDLDKKFNIIVEYEVNNVKKQKLVKTHKGRKALISEKNIIRFDHGINNILYLSLKQTANIIQVYKVSMIKNKETNLLSGFKLFCGCETLINEVIMENSVSFKKFIYPTRFLHIQDKFFMFEFEIPLTDILSSPITKWELMSKNFPVKIRKSKNFSYNNEKISFRNFNNELLISYIITENPSIFKTRNKNIKKSKNSNSNNFLKEFIIKIQDMYQKKFENHYFEIKEHDNALIFNIQSPKFFKKFLIIKHRKTGKRISIPIKNSKAKLNINELSELGELGNYEILLKTKVFNRIILSRTKFHKQNHGKKIIDFNNQRIFESYQTLNSFLSFKYKEELFTSQVLSCTSNDKFIELNANLILFKDINFDNMELVLYSNNEILKIPSEYKKLGKKITLKTNINLELFEKYLGSLFIVEIRLIENNFVLCESSLKSNKQFIDKVAENILYQKTNNINYCALIFTNNRSDLLIKIVDENSCNEIINSKTSFSKN